MTQTATKSGKITLATLKAFVKANTGNIYVNVESDFDGMTDCVESRNGGFEKREFKNEHIEQTLGYRGLWLVRGSRDYFQPYKDEHFTGIRVYNACGSSIIATTI